MMNLLYSSWNNALDYSRYPRGNTAPTVLPQMHYRYRGSTVQSVPSPRYYCEILPIPTVITAVTAVLPHSPLPCHSLVATCTHFCLLITSLKCESLQWMETRLINSREIDLTSLITCMLNHGLQWDKWVSNELTYRPTLQSPDNGLTDTYSTVVDGRSCSLHCRSFGHAWVHPWSYQPVIPLQT